MASMHTWLGRIVGSTLIALMLMLGIAPSALAQSATVKAVQDPTLGLILTDNDGRTLYRFTRDTINTASACYNQCAATWPPLLVGDGVPAAGDGVDGNLLGVLTRTDGTHQVMYNGMPLYYYAGDAVAGETKGQGFRDVWFIVKPNTTTVGGQGVTLKAAQNASLGSILTDGNGKTLYLFTRDTPNTSVCYDRCATAWPPLLVGSGVTVALDGIGGTVGSTMRRDGNLQVTYNEKPLYYYITDKNPGDTTGQGVGGVWFVINPTAASSASPATPAAPTQLPTTGGNDSPVALMALLALVLLLGGFALRRRHRAA